MSYFGRLFLVVVRGLFAPRIGPLEESRLRFHVLPGDLDANLHMNNGRYLSLMDLGRFDLGIRMGLLGEARRRHWRPLVGSAMIRFRRSLAPFQSFLLRSRVLCWDDRWIVFEQRLERAGQICAVALVRALFRGPDGNVPPSEVLHAGGLTPGSSPPVPEYVRLWATADDGAYDAARAT